MDVVGQESDELVGGPGRSMNMSGDAKWNALVDSVKADLADLPSLGLSSPPGSRSTPGGSSD
jgi:hypothetical protein